MGLDGCLCKCGAFVDRADLMRTFCEPTPKNQCRKCKTDELSTRLREAGLAHVYNEAVVNELLGPVDNATNQALHRLDLTLQHTYRTAAQTTIQRNRRALQRIVDGFDESQYVGYTPEMLESQRQFYAREVISRESQDGGVIAAIIAGIALCGRRAAQSIQGSLPGLYSNAYRAAAADINRQLRVSFTSSVRLPVSTEEAQLRILQSQAQQSPFTQIAFQNLGLTSANQRLQMVNLLQNQMRNVIISGGNVDDLTQIVRNAFNQQHMGLNRARRIAKQETRRLYHQGKYEAWKQSIAMGIITVRVWIHTGRSEVPRADHLAMSGTLSDENGMFTLPNGEKTPHPIGPGLSAKQSIGCTCDTVDRVISDRPVSQSYIENARRVITKQLEDAGII